jgi:glutamate formiminotransferase
VRLVECIPNFSEGRQPDTITAITSALASVEGVHVLNISSDPYHNRTVITFAAPPHIIGEAAFQAIKTASQRIDMNDHQGVHPRIGAADVVPFVPLRDVTMADCIAIARELGCRVAEELDIPVYLYEQAATRPERVNLAEVRRDPYERLKSSIQHDPRRTPDFGPPLLGKAGAVAIGARGPLIAFNVYLNTDDVAIARAIARAIRESSGGLPYIKALGLLVGGRAQVSINMVDYRQTSLFTLMEAVRTQAQQHGSLVTHTELVGLVPQTALIQAALDYLQLPSQAGDLILERRLGAAVNDFRDVTFE